MSKKTTLDTVAAAIAEQIATYRRPLAWRVATAKSILKIKEKAAKPTVEARSAEELQSDIIAAVRKYVGKLGVRKLQGIISGSISLNDAVSGISTTITRKPEPTKAEAITEDTYKALLSQMNKPQLFAMLQEAANYTKPAKAAKAAPKSGGYVSISDEVAYSIAYEYLSKLTEGGRACSPQGFLGKRTANPTTALRRFIFSTICKGECSIYNSMPATVADYYKANAPEIVADAEAQVMAILDEHKDILEMIRGWQGEPYIKAVLSK